MKGDALGSSGNEDVVRLAGVTKAKLSEHVSAVEQLMRDVG